MGRRFGSKNGMGRAGKERREETRKSMVGVGLQVYLHNLVEEILSGTGAGSEGLLADFQEFIQYAPPELRETIQRRLETRLP